MTQCEITCIAVKKHAYSNRNKHSPMSDTELLELVYQADKSEYGIAVKTDNPTTLRNQFNYIIKKEELLLSTYVVGDEVWIKPKAAEPENE